jgi:hypothetical protein
MSTDHDHLRDVATPEPSMASPRSTAEPWPIGMVHSEQANRERAARILRSARRAASAERDELTQLAAAVLPDSRAAMRLRIRSLLADNHHEAAEALIARGLLIYPHDAALMEYRASALLERGRLHEAKQEIARLLRKQPTRIGGLRIGAAVATRMKDHYRAVMLLTRAHLCRPECERIRRDLAEALIASGQHDAAIELINAMPLPLPRLRAMALRRAGRLLDAAEAVSLALDAAIAEHGQKARCTTEFDELLCEALTVAEMRGDNSGIDSLTKLITLDTPRAQRRLAMLDLSRGRFRRAMRRAVPLIRQRQHQAGALPIVIAAAAMLERSTLAARALRRFRAVSRTTNTPAMREAWQRAMLGSIINDQRSAQRACADPTSSLLKPLLKQAKSTIERHLRRRTATHLPDDVVRLREQYQLCRHALAVQDRRSALMTALRGEDSATPVGAGS